MKLTFANLVDTAIEVAKKDTASLALPSAKEIEDNLKIVLRVVDEQEFPWTFIRETHRGYGYDTLASDMYKRYLVGEFDIYE